MITRCSPVATSLDLMVCKLDQQTIYSEFISHWVPSDLWSCVISKPN